MPAEGWALVAVQESAVETILRKAIAHTGLRATCAHNLEEGESLLRRRGFICAFLDLPRFKALARKGALMNLTYTVLLVEPKNISRALNLQSQEKIHDWLSAEPRDSDIEAMVQRARTYQKQAAELDSIRSASSRAAQEDAAILFCGKWATATSTWINKVSRQENPLLITGESGCGKTHFARLVHYTSAHGLAPFVSVKCHAKETPVLEREIFGEIPPRSHATAPMSRQSQITLAANGTLLLEGINHMPRRVQQRLARAIQSQTYSPVGGGDKLPFRARVIATLNTDEPQDAHPKNLHRDLSRLWKKTTMKIPPLRGRQEDFPEIINATLQRIERKYGLPMHGVTGGALTTLKEYAWPGNFRELERVLWTASLRSPKEKISQRMVAPILSNGNGSAAAEENALEEVIKERLQNLFQRFGVDHLQDLHPMMVERTERPLIALVLKQTKGNQLRASRILGINRNTLRRKMKQYEIQISA